MKDSPQLEPVIFRKNEDGNLAARIDNLEVLFEQKGLCSILVWGEETAAPCEYTSSVCPEEKGRDWRNCPVAENCPYLMTTEIEEDTTCFMNEGNMDELETKIRKMFRTGDDGIGHPQEWPQPAASRFAHAEWRFEE